MAMSMKDRKRIRALQNKLIKLAKKRGYDEYKPISGDLPAEITLFNLGRMIYPAFEGHIRTMIVLLETA